MTTSRHGVTALVVYHDRSRGPQPWRWRLVGRNGRVMAVSGEGFVSRRNARRAGVRVSQGLFVVQIRGGW